VEYITIVATCVDSIARDDEVSRAGLANNKLLRRKTVFLSLPRCRW
jgi:hypothetical protein